MQAGRRRAASARSFLFLFMHDAIVTIRLEAL